MSSVEKSGYTNCAKSKRFLIQEQALMKYWGLNVDTNKVRQKLVWRIPRHFRNIKFFSKKNNYNCVDSLNY